MMFSPEQSIFWCVAFISIGFMAFVCAPEYPMSSRRKVRLFWLGWMIFWFLPVGFRVLVSAYMG